MIDGMLVDDWIEQNADDIWLTQNGMYDVLDARQRKRSETDNYAISVYNNDDPENSVLKRAPNKTLKPSMDPPLEPGLHPEPNVASHCTLALVLGSLLSFRGPL